jgi:flagellar protein FlaG
MQEQSTPARRHAVEISRVDGTGDYALPTSYTTLTPKEREEQQQLVQAVSALNKAELFGEDQELRFVYDRHSKKPILRVVDKQTDEVIRQVPPEYVLRLADSVED